MVGIITIISYITYLSFLYTVDKKQKVKKMKYFPILIAISTFSFIYLCYLIQNSHLMKLTEEKVNINHLVSYGRVNAFDTYIYV